MARSRPTAPLNPPLSPQSPFLQAPRDDCAFGAKETSDQSMAGPFD
jgi:hypothetical protein